MRDNPNFVEMFNAAPSMGEEIRALNRSLDQHLTDIIQERVTDNIETAQQEYIAMNENKPVPSKLPEPTCTRDRHGNITGFGPPKEEKFPYAPNANYWREIHTIFPPIGTDVGPRDLAPRVVPLLSLDEIEQICAQPFITHHQYITLLNQRHIIGRQLWPPDWIHPMYPPLEPETTATDDDYDITAPGRRLDDPSGQIDQAPF